MEPEPILKPVYRDLSSAIYHRIFTILYWASCCIDASLTHSPPSLMQLKNVYKLPLIKNNIKITSVAHVSALLGHLQQLFTFFNRPTALDLKSIYFQAIALSWLTFRWANWRFGGPWKWQASTACYRDSFTLLTWNYYYKSNNISRYSYLVLANGTGFWYEDCMV
jgi:hypothetical protein